MTSTWKNGTTAIYLEVGCGLVNPTGGGREVTSSNLRPLAGLVGSHETEQVMNIIVNIIHNIIIVCSIVCAMFSKVNK